MTDNPYAAPTATSYPAAAEFLSEKQYTYRPLGTLLTLITVVMLGLCLAFISISAIDTFGALTFPTFTDPTADVESDLEMNLIYGQLAFGIFSGLAFIVEGILVCMFLYRANANLRALGTRHLEHTPGWCAGYWFIPLVNLYKPYQLTKEIYRASHRPGGDEWRTLSITTGILPLWWTGWLVGRIVTSIESRLGTAGVDAGAMALPITWTSTLFTVLSGCCLIVILRTIRDAQEKYISQLSPLPGTPTADLFTP